VAVNRGEKQLPPSNESARPLLGIGLKVGATFAFTLMAAIAREIGQDIPVGQIVFFRSAFAFIPIGFALLAVGGGFGSLATKRPWQHARRAFTGVFAMFTYFSALTYLPIADVTAISFASPLIVVVLSALILGETVRAYRWGAVIAGFVGVLVMLSPHVSAGATLEPASMGILFGLANAVLVAFTMIFIRMMSETESALAITAYFQLTCSVVSGLTLPFVWVTPSGEELVLLILLGVLGGIGQLLMTNGYRYAQASTLAQFDYVAMIWAVLFGWLFFSEFPHTAVYVGAVIVIGSGLFVVWRERRLGLERRGESAVEPI
jgi:drug/metabolite transporter (DMT)-like permease